MQELNYTRCGDYYIPDIRLPEENRPIGRWGRMHRDYLKEYHPIRFNDLCLSGELWTYLADLNEQAQNRLEVIIEQMKASEGVTESMKQANPMAWVGAMNSIRNRAEEIILAKYSYCQLKWAVLKKPALRDAYVRNKINYELNMVLAEANATFDSFAEEYIVVFH